MNEFMNTVFRLCVELLIAGAKYFGTTYEIINGWIFCIIGPILFTMLLVTVVVQQYSLVKCRTMAACKNHPIP